MRNWGSSMDSFFGQLFAQDLESIDPVHHPTDEVLRAYLKGQLGKDWHYPEELWQGFSSHELRTWPHREASAHLLICERCRDRVRLLQLEEEGRRTLWTSLRAWLADLQEQLRPIPRPALVTLAVQSFVIVGLMGLLFFQPTPLPGTSSQGAGTPKNMAGVLPSFASQAIETIKQDPNPKNRLQALQLLQQYQDPRLVEPLTEVLDKEPHPQVRQAIAQTLFSILITTESQYFTLRQTIQRTREKHSQEFGFFFQVGIGDLRQFLRGLSELQTEMPYPVEIFCQGRPDLQLGQLIQLASELDGVLVIDRFVSTGSFRLRLPPTLGGVQTIQQLESRLGIVCRP